MEVHQVKAKQGLQWIMSGFYLFRAAPAAWILLTFTLILIAMSLALVPLLGQFVFTLISPVFLAGLMIGCKGLEQGEKLELSCLFIAFKTNPTPLITIGGIYLIGQVLIVGVVMLIGGTVMVDMLLYGKRVDESELMGVMSSIMTASLIAISLSVPLIMAAWFSPLLVIFHNVPPVQAMKKSFFACLRNFIPFQLYGVVIVILAIIAIVPYGLGLFILTPTIFASIYVSYKDIFLAEPIVIKNTETIPANEKASWENTEETPEKPEEDTVKCAQCDIHIPKNEAIIVDDRFFCSDEHRRQYEEEMKKKKEE